METPVIPSNTGHNSLVYEPAEDSFLLLDALELELGENWNGNNFKDKAVILALEVGCGSGIISTALAKSPVLSNVLPCVFAIDINPHACLLTQKTAEANIIGSSKVQPILVDGNKNLSKVFREPLDLIVCNPPYVPVVPGENEEDAASGVLEKSWSGGPDGNEFIVPFLADVSSMLNPSGVLYLLLSSWNNPESLLEKVARPNGLEGTLVIKRTAGRERLSVWRFHKSEILSSTV